MRILFLTISTTILLFLAGCTPRSTLNMNLLKVTENEGLALEVHVVAVDQALQFELERYTVEEMIANGRLDRLTGAQEETLEGAQKAVITASRINDRKDFIAIVDLAGVEGGGQRLFLGSKYYRAKDIYIIIDRDRLRVVTKEDFDRLYNSNLSRR